MQIILYNVTEKANLGSGISKISNFKFKFHLVREDRVRDEVLVNLLCYVCETHLVREDGVRDKVLVNLLCCV